MHGHPCRADLYNKNEDTYCQISQMTPPGHRQTTWGGVYMAYTDHEWPAIIGLDLGKQTYSGCRLSGEGYVKRHNFTGKMTRGGDGYACLLEKICDGDLVIMEAGSSSFNLARFLMNSTGAEIVVLNPAQLRLPRHRQEEVQGGCGIQASYCRDPSHRAGRKGGKDHE